MADQPLAIAIMHKHDPVPVLPPDVPRPVADLVYGLLAKTPEGRPETAQHVADRAEIIREARDRSGHTGPITADLPVVPNFPPAEGNDFYNDEPERSGGSRSSRRGLLLAGVGLAACGIIAIIAVLLTSSPTPAAGTINQTGKPTSPAASASHTGRTATTSVPATSADDGGLGTNLEEASKTPSARSSAGPTSSGRHSPTPTKSAPSTSTSPSASATSSSPSPTGSATTSPAGPTGSPTGSPTTTVPSGPTGSPTPITGPTVAGSTEG
jgi:hypothetical protein